MKNIYWYIIIAIVVVYYSYILFILYKNKKNKNVEKLQKNTNFVNNSTFNESSFKSILDEMEDEIEHHTLLDEFNSSDVEGNINPLTQKNEIFKVIKNDENSVDKKPGASSS